MGHSKQKYLQNSIPRGLPPARADLLFKDQPVRNSKSDHQNVQPSPPPPLLRPLGHGLHPFLRGTGTEARSGTTKLFFYVRVSSYLSYVFYTTGAKESVFCLNIF